MRPLLGLAPGGVYHAATVAGRAVGAYPTLSPLPLTKVSGGLLSVALSLGLRRAGVTRRPVSMEPGLSSITGPKAGNSGCPAAWSVSYISGSGRTCQRLAKLQCAV